jgi:glycosyltransferase involved in cell wall biosynthesis
MSAFSSLLRRLASSATRWKKKLPVLNLRLFRKNFTIEQLKMTPKSNGQPTPAKRKHTESRLHKVGVVIPAFNEERNLVPLLIKLKKSGYKNILIVDGKSTDQTVEVAEKMGAVVIIQSGHGKGSAIREVLSNGYMDVDTLILMDADGSMSPEEIPIFLQALKSGADMVKGSRFLKGGGTHDMSLIRKIGNLFLVSAVNLLCLTGYTDLCYGFLVFNKQSIKRLAPLLTSQNFEIEAEILVKAKKLGLNVAEVPSTEFKRRNGASNLKTFRDGFLILQTILREFLKSSKIYSQVDLN